MYEPSTVNPQQILKTCPQFFPRHFSLIFVWCKIIFLNIFRPVLNTIRPSVYRLWRTFSCVRIPSCNVADTSSSSSTKLRLLSVSFIGPKRRESGAMSNYRVGGREFRKAVFWRVVNIWASVWGCVLLLFPKEGDISTEFQDLGF